MATSTHQELEDLCEDIRRLCEDMTMVVKALKARQLQREGRSLQEVKDIHFPEVTIDVRVSTLRRCACALK